MHRTRIAVSGNLKGTVDKFIDSVAIRYAGTVFCQWGSDCDIVNFLKTAGALAFQRA